jgi:hypothetical protein
MNFIDILEELANLTHQERRELGVQLLSFETDDDHSSSAVSLRSGSCFAHPVA